MQDAIFSDATKSRRKIFDRVVNDQTFTVYRFPNWSEHKGVRGCFAVKLSPTNKGDFEAFYINDGDTWPTLELAKDAIEKYLNDEIS